MTSLAMSAALELSESSWNFCVAVLLSGLGQVRDAGITPSCFICEKTSTTPQISAIRPPAKRKMKISL